MIRWQGLLAGGLIVCLAAGCGRSGRPRPASTRSVPAAVPTKPAPLVAQATAAPAVAIPTPGPEAGVIAGQVRMADGRPAAEAIIGLDNPPAGTAAAPGEAVTLRQRAGTFEPRILIVTKGTALRLASADDRADFRASGAAAFSLTLPRGRTEQRQLTRAGLVVVRSELHPQAAAYIWVFDHPFHARTDAAGRFRLPPLPAGKYRVTIGYAAARPVQQQFTVDLGADRGTIIEWQIPAEP